MLTNRDDDDNDDVMMMMMMRLVRSVLGALQEDGDDYSRACSIQVLHGDGCGVVAAQAASTPKITTCVSWSLQGVNSFRNPLEILEGHGDFFFFFCFLLASLYWESERDRHPGL